MPALDEILQQKLALLDASHKRRRPIESERREGVYVTRAGKRLISFSCNDYLGLSSHPRVIAAAHEALDNYGAGAGASRLVTGNHPLFAGLEAALAAHKGTEAACVFGSGYLANIGAIAALVGKGDLILMDKLSHACMLDGARLSGADVMRFAHNNLEHLSLLLSSNRQQYQHCLILTETVFSMDGDRAPLTKLAAIAHRYDAWLMTDSAHDLFPPTTNHQPPATIQMGTLSKALGTYGGYVCGSQTLIDYLQSAARSFIYSTGLPPATVAAATAALSVINDQPELCGKPLEHARLFTSLLGMPPAESAIVPVVLKQNDKALEAAARLEEKGFLVSAIRPPTVPEHTARLRFAFSALHEPAQIEQAAKIVKQEGWA